MQHFSVEHIVPVMQDRAFVRPTDHPSNRESLIPTDRPVLLKRKTNIVLTAATSTLFIATIKVADVGRHLSCGFLCSGYE